MKKSRVSPTLSVLEARVNDKVRDESQDTSLITVMAKLAVLEHTLESRRREVGIRCCK
jgi:hypothetical protein